MAVAVASHLFNNNFRYGRRVRALDNLQPESYQQNQNDYIDYLCCDLHSCVFYSVRHTTKPDVSFLAEPLAVRPTMHGFGSRNLRS